MSSNMSFVILRSISVCRFGNVRIGHVCQKPCAQIKDDCALDADASSLTQCTLEKGAKAAWLGYYPKSGETSKLWGTHLVGFSREAAFAFASHIDQEPVTNWYSLDVFFRNNLRRGLLCEIAQQSLAHQRTHVLKGRK